MGTGAGRCTTGRGKTTGLAGAGLGGTTFGAGGGGGGKVTMRTDTTFLTGLGVGGVRGMDISPTTIPTSTSIAADKKVPFQDFVRVMDHCQKAGVTSIGIATQAKV